MSLMLHWCPNPPRPHLVIVFGDSLGYEPLLLYLTLTTEPPQSYTCLDFSIFEVPPVPTPLGDMKTFKMEVFDVVQECHL